MWDDVGLGRSDGIDDAAFIAALVDRLVSDGVARHVSGGASSSTHTGEEAHASAC